MPGTAVEIDWQALALDGTMNLYLDGSLKETLTRIDNDTRNLAFDAGRDGRGREHFRHHPFRRLRFASFFLTSGTLLDPGTDPGPSYEPSPYLTDLVSWWSLDETSGTRVDSHGTNGLTDVNTTGYDTGVLARAARYVNASSEYLSHGRYINSLSHGDKDFSYFTWIYLDNLSSSQLFLNKWASSNNEIQALVDTSGYVQWYVSSDGTASSSVSSSTFGALSTGTWYMVMVNHDADDDTIGVSINAGTIDTTAYSSGVYDGTRNHSRWVLEQPVPWVWMVNKTSPFVMTVS